MKKHISYCQCLRHYLIFFSRPISFVFLVHMLLNCSKGETCLRKVNCMLVLIFIFSFTLKCFMCYYHDGNLLSKWKSWARPIRNQNKKWVLFFAANRCIAIVQDICYSSTYRSGIRFSITVDILSIKLWYGWLLIIKLCKFTLHITCCA